MKDGKKLPKYQPSEIEGKWQEKWKESKLYEFDPDSEKTSYYTLVELPYPSGDLHLGHWFAFVPPDAHARYERMTGKNTFFPNGFDAFGLPAENAAIKRGIHPQDWTLKNIETMKGQFATMGTMIDWSHEAITCLPEYYRWNQWIFLKMYEKGLAYRGKTLSNWCPSCQTVLANEAIEDGKCWRCGTIVQQKEIEQWFLKITEYADKLLWDNIDQKTSNAVKWPRSVREGQNNWIGRSEGAEITFSLKGKYNFILLHGFGGTPEGNSWLKKRIEDQGYHVDSPELPNTTNPTEAEQVKFVLDNCELDENTILYGHSLGSIVAMKVVEHLKHPIAGLVLSGTFREPKFKDSPRPFEKTFGFDFDAQKIKENTGFIRVIHDVNDHAVFDDQAQKVADMLGVSLESVEAQQPHFGGEEEPELLKRILPSVTVYTVYPETIFGVTYMVLAPEHPLSSRLATKEHEAEVVDYIKRAKEKTELERKTLDKEKTGVFTGSYCISPVTGEQIPIWIADYVIAKYGTGAVMGVPGSDERDYEFAKKYDLPVKRVIGKNDKDTGAISNESDVLEEGILVNSGEFSGLQTPAPAREKMKEWMISEGFASRKLQYHLHDWSVSRQRYWGTPVPMIHCETCGIVPVSEKDLPIELPYEVDYTPKGKPPLASAEEWMKVDCPKCGEKARRDPETLDTFFDSSWYYYRYLDPKFEKGPFDQELAKKLMPLDIYFGGAEHTLGHTLYARFFTKFFYDLGLIDFDEFAKKRVQHGVILGPDGNRMSKSRGNVVNPDDVVREYGADTVRVYLSFMMPYEDTVAPWNPKAIAGIYRFLRRIWDLFEKVQSTQQSVLSSEDLYQMHKTIKKVGEDLENIKFNTAIASMMEWLNYLSVKESVSLEEYKTMVLLLAPFAPHIAEEIWQELNKTELTTKNQTEPRFSVVPRKVQRGSAFESIHTQSWPEYKEEYLQTETVTIAVQVNGKLRGSFEVESGSVDDQAALEAKAKEIENIRKHLDGKKILKVVYIKGKLMNFVVKD